MASATTPSPVDAYYEPVGLGLLDVEPTAIPHLWHPLVPQYDQQFYNVPIPSFIPDGWL